MRWHLIQSLNKFLLSMKNGREAMDELTHSNYLEKAFAGFLLWPGCTRLLL